MPQKRAAYKEIRKAGKRRLRNARIASEVNTLIKEFNLFLSEKKLDRAREFLKKVSSKLDKAAAKGVIRKNTVSRKVSRLSKRLHKAALAKK